MFEDKTKTNVCIRYSCTGHSKEDTAHVVGQNQIGTHFVGHLMKGDIRENVALFLGLMQGRTQFSRRSFKGQARESKRLTYYLSAGEK